jgi:hypothetical protein
MMTKQARNQTTHLGDEHITRLRGFAWYAFQDQTTSTGIAGEHPFGIDTAPGAGGPVGEPVQGEPLAELPKGVLAAWVVPRVYEGLINRGFGGAYLVLTETDDRPPVNDGWDVEPARLDENFNMEQRGDRWVRLGRVLGSRHVDGRELLEVEMEVDRT